MDNEKNFYSKDYNDFNETYSVEISNTSQKKRKFKKIAGSAAAVAACAALVVGSVYLGINIGTNYGENDDLTIASSNSSSSEKNENYKIPENNSTYTLNTDPLMLTGTNTIAPILKKVENSVVNISIKTTSKDYFFNQSYETSGAGSGIIYDQDDEKVYIVTNNHVVDGASSVSISITGEEQVQASLIGKNAQADLAVIYVLKSDLIAQGINEVTPAVFADSDNLDVGEYVLAVGNALGEGKTVTQGIISARNKTINIDGKKLTVIQTDAAINPGNSGGALINTDGEVVGVNTAKLSSSSVEGIGYAIPSSIVKTVVEDLIVNGTTETPYFGIMGFTIDDKFRSYYNLSVEGVFVSKVEDGSSADAAGLQYTDIITEFNGTKISTIEELSSAIQKCKVNDTVTIQIVRNGVTPMQITAILKSSSQNF